MLEGLEPFTLYLVSVKARNSAGIGPEAAMGVVTKEGCEFTFVLSLICGNFWQFGPPVLPATLGRTRKDSLCGCL